MNLVHSKQTEKSEEATSLADDFRFLKLVFYFDFWMSTVNKLVPLALVCSEISSGLM